MKCKAVPVHTMKANGGADVQRHSFLISALDGAEWSTTRPGRFTPRKERRYPLYRRLGGSRSQLEHFGIEVQTVHYRAKFAHRQNCIRSQQQAPLSAPKLKGRGFPGGFCPPRNAVVIQVQQIAGHFSCVAPCCAPETNLNSRPPQ